MGDMSEEFAEGNEFEEQQAQSNTKYSDVKSQLSSTDVAVDEALNDKEEERRRIQTDIEAFLSQGGTISKIDPNVMADPPKKPTSNYGGQPI